MHNPSVIGMSATFEDIEMLTNMGITCKLGTAHFGPELA